MQQGKTRRIRTDWLAKVAMLGAIGGILMFLELTIPFVPPFLKLDFSDIPAFLAGFALGPTAGIAVVFIRNMIHFLFGTWSRGVGELANFIIGVSFVLPASLIYARRKNKKNAMIGMIIGVLTMTAFAALANYFFLIPFYAVILGIPVGAIVEMSTAINVAIVDLKTLVIWGITPFNLFKGAMNILIMLLIYKRLSPILHYRRKPEKYHF